MRKYFFGGFTRKEKTTETRPPTNGDKMRAMTDKDLAAWCHNAVSCAVCPMLPACKGNVATCEARWYAYFKAVSDV